MSLLGPGNPGKLSINLIFACGILLKTTPNKKQTNNNKASSSP